MHQVAIVTFKTSGSGEAFAVSEQWTDIVMVQILEGLMKVSCSNIVAMVLCL